MPPYLNYLGCGFARSILAVVCSSSYFPGLWGCGAKRLGPWALGGWGDERQRGLRCWGAERHRGWDLRDSGAEGLEPGVLKGLRVWGAKGQRGWIGRGRKRQAHQSSYMRLALRQALSSGSCDLWIASHQQFLFGFSSLALPCWSQPSHTIHPQTGLEGNLISKPLLFEVTHAFF